MASILPFDISHKLILYQTSIARRADWFLVSGISAETKKIKQISVPSAPRAKRV
jgi:hypothetical protein